MTPEIPKKTLRGEFHGTVPYDEGISMMEQAARALVAGGGPACLLMFEHPPTITLGVRGGLSSVLITKGELATRGLTLKKANRGGDATWHGPGQLVGYPVVDLGSLGLTVPDYVSSLEKALTRWLLGKGLSCGTIPGRPGVWAPGGGKIVSIGVRVSRCITTHGFALNLCGDLPGSDAIVPCGIAGVKLTTLEAESGTKIDPKGAAHEVAIEVGDAMGMTTEFYDLNNR